jgi:hypothetical protein
MHSTIASACDDGAVLDHQEAHLAKANGHYQEFQQEFHLSGAQATSDVTDHTEPVQSGSASNRTVIADSEVLPDSRIVDIVSLAHQQESLALLTWQSGRYEVAHQINVAGVIYVPPQLPRGLASAVRFPTGLGEILTPRELLAEIDQILVQFIDMDDVDRFLISAFSLSTFFSDRLPVVPHLAICGPPGSGKTTLLRLMHCMTRRALHAGDLTRSSLYKLVDLFAPTLLIDEADFDGGKASRDMMRLLRNGNRRGADTYVNGQRFCIFGPKVISSRIPIGNAALASRFIHINMLPSNAILPVLDEGAERRIAGVMHRSWNGSVWSITTMCSSPRRLISAVLPPGCVPVY